MGSSTGLSRNIAITLIISCALVGGYAGMYLSYTSGFFQAIGHCTSHASGRPCVLPIPESRRLVYTNIPFVDERIAVLIEFFAFGLNGPNSVAMTLASAYLVGQFGVAWYIMALEGLRKGNASTALA